MQDGVPLCLDATTASLGERVPCGRVLVDNSGIPGISDEILRDRNNLAKDGVVSVAVVIDPERGEVVGEPILQSKGFHGPDGVLDAAGETLLDALMGLGKEQVCDVDNLRHNVSDLVRRFIQKKTSLRPLVLPTIVEV
jgi:ribonuclease J